MQKMIRGSGAIAAAQKGAALFVFNPQRGWIPAGAGALGRALRSSEHATYCYGVRAPKKARKIQ